MKSQVYSSIESALNEIFDSKHKADYDPHFWWYWRADANAALPKSMIQRLLQQVVDDFDLAHFEPTNKYVLDAGCGFGLTVLMTRLMGACESHGIDHSITMINTFEKYLTFLQNIDGIFPKVGNVNETGYRENYFDFVLSNEAISHYLDIPGFILESYRILKPGGVLFISDGNNGANPYISWRTKILWGRFENGPTGKVFYSNVDEPYIKMRMRIIREEYPSFNEQEIRMLAENTFCYDSYQIRIACDTYKSTKVKPESKFRFGVTPVNPEENQFQERLINPLSLEKQLTKVGFKVKVFAHFGGAGGNRNIRLINRVIEKLSPITLSIARTLKVVAIKPSVYE